MRRSFVAGVVFCGAALVSSLVGAASALASEATTCAGSHVGETFPDGLTVPAGQRCNLSHVTVEGNAVVGEGGALVASDSHITGNLSAQGATVQLTRTTVDNDFVSVRPTNFQVSENSFLAKVVMCGSTVGGSVTITNAPSFGSIRLGGPVCGSVGGNTIGGNLVDRDNTATAHDIYANKAALMVCSGNSVAPSGSGNTARLKSGQCAAL